MMRLRMKTEPRITETICLEGNGARPSHKGDGWHEGGVMYTLNSTEVHCVAYASNKAEAHCVTYAIDHVVTGGGIVRHRENAGMKKSPLH